MLTIHTVRWRHDHHGLQQAIDERVISRWREYQSREGRGESMTIEDPYTPTGAYIYECRDCLTRIRSSTVIRECPECGGTVQNIAVARE